MATETLSPKSGLELAREAAPNQIRAAGWARRNALDLVIVASIVVILGVIHASGMFDYPARFDDEGAYMSQAWAVLSRFDLSHYTYWYDHPPLGWLLLATYSLVTGALERAPYGVAAGREAVFVFHLVSVALLYLLARRIGMRRLFAVIAVALYGLSPLGVFFHRMVLLDNLAMPFLLGGFALLFSPRKRLGAHVLAAAAFAVAILIRETFVVFVPIAFILYWRRTEPRTRPYSLALTGTTFVGIVALYPLFALLRGELLPSDDRVSLLGALGWQLFEREGSGSALDPNSPAGQVMAGWLGHDPWILAFGVLAAVGLLLVPRLRWVGVTVVVLLVMLLRPGYLPVMFVVSALPFLALALAGGLDQTWVVARSGTGGAKRVIPTLLTAACVIAVAVVLTPSYQAGVARATSLEADLPFAEAQAWLGENLENDDVVLLDGALWLDVVRGGHPQDNTIWYYKIDTDPEITLPPPGDWRAVDYVVVTDVIRTTTYELPEVETVIENSEQVAVFGEGSGQVEIRAVQDR